jgi:hypothetical protein
VWLNGRKHRGYEIEAFLEPWERYIGAAPPTATDGRTVGVTASTAPDLVSTVLPFPPTESPVYQEGDGKGGCSRCGATFGHMSTCPEGGPKLGRHRQTRADHRDHAGPGARLDHR